jgi:hypothetical protein
MKTALTIDPGGTTGYCITRLIQYKPTILTVGQKKMTHMQLYEFIKDTDPDILIYEDFEYRPGHLIGLDMFAKELVGVMKLYSEVCNSLLSTGIATYEQKPARKEAFSKRKRLEEMGCWATGKEHGRDAVRHFLYWFYFAQGNPHRTVESEVFRMEVV